MTQPVQSTLSPRLVVGIGSHHGNDQLGWMAARKIAAQNVPNVATEVARTPVDLLNWLVGSSLTELHLVDACQKITDAGKIHQLDWPIREQSAISFSGSHDFSTLAALELAASLNLLPPRVVVWAVEVPAFDNAPIDSAQRISLDSWSDSVASRVLAALRPTANFSQ